MWKSEFETMTIENTTDFRRLLRILFFLVQEIRFFYSDSKFQLDYFITFSQQIDHAISQILHSSSFSERRKPIQDFFQSFVNFQNSFQSHYDEFFINIKESLNEVLKKGLETQEIIQVSNFDLKNSSSWDQFCEPLQKLNFGSNYNFINKINTISDKGKVISSIYDIFAQIEQFYNDFPKELSENEIEKRKLDQKIRFLESQVTKLKKENQSLDTQNKNIQSKFHILQVSYKNLEESIQKTQGELREVNKLKELADVQIAQFKDFFSKYRRQNDDDEEFDPDTFAQFIKDNQDEFDEIMFELNL